MPTSRVAQGVRLLVETASTVNAQEIRMQPVQGISGAGRYVIDGATVSAVGTARLAVGQIVPVVYESGQPLVIFALEWQRGRGEVGQEPALGVVEELLLLRAASPDAGSLWFRGESQIIKLEVVAAAQAGSITLGLANITALKWGEDQNSFVLQGTIPVSSPPAVDDGKIEFFLFALSRSRAGETVGGVTFLRRERPWSRSDITLGTVAAALHEEITGRSVVPKIEGTIAAPVYAGTEITDVPDVIDVSQTVTLTMLGSTVTDFDLNSRRELVVLATAADFGMTAYEGGARWNQWLVNLTTKGVLWSSDKRSGASWGRVRSVPSITNTRLKTIPIQAGEPHPGQPATGKYFLTKDMVPPSSPFEYTRAQDTFFGDPGYQAPSLLDADATVANVSGEQTIYALLDGLSLPFIGASLTVNQPTLTAVSSVVPDFSYIFQVMATPGTAATFSLSIKTGYDVPASTTYLLLDLACISPGAAASGSTPAIPALLFVGVLKIGPDVTDFGKGGGLSTQRWGVFVVDSGNQLLATLTPGFDPTSAATILATRYKLVESDAVNFDAVDVQLLSASRRHALWARYREATTEIYLSSIPTQMTRLLATDATGQIQLLLSEALQALPPDMLYEVQSLLRSIAGTKRTTDQRFGVGWNWNTGALDAALTLDPVTLDAAGELLLDGTRPQEDAALAGAGTLVPLGAVATKIVRSRSLHGLQIVNSQERLGPAGRYRQEGT